jgi:colicin import membrane protein
VTIINPKATTPNISAQQADNARVRREQGQAREDFAPRRLVGMSRGAALALVAHVGLIAAIAAGVRWQTREPEVLSAELWAATVQQAAPAAVTPPPAPPPVPQPRPTPPPPAAERQPTDAQIALARQREEQQRKDNDKKEAEQRKQREEDKERKLAQAKKDKADRDARAAERKASADEAKLAKQREDQLQRLRALAGATGSANATGTAAQDTAPSAEYGGRIRAIIKRAIVLTEALPGNPVAEVELRLANTGRVTGRRLVKSSGNKMWDEAVMRAAERTDILPRDADGRIPPVIVLELRPNE